MDKLNIEIGLFRLLTGLWPKRIHRKIVSTDWIFPLLKTEAIITGVDSEHDPEYFDLSLSFSLVGFKVKNDGSKAVFRPNWLSCVVSFTSGVCGFDKELTGGLLAAAARFCEVPKEIEIDIPRLEKIPLPRVCEDGFIVETEEIYWRMAK